MQVSRPQSDSLPAFVPTCGGSGNAITAMVNIVLDRTTSFEKKLSLGEDRGGTSHPAKSGNWLYASQPYSDLNDEIA
jgi:hypothetical protein